MNQRLTVPVFFSSDEKYIPFLGVTVRSLIDNASSDNDYNIYILNNGLSEESINNISSMATDNVKIQFVNVEEKLKNLCGIMNLRDYYTVSIYFRLFIPSMFPDTDRAIYMDCDLVILDDVAKLYSIDIGDSILGVVSDKVVAAYKILHNYTENVLGIDYRRYFNSGMMLMNLKKFREENIEERFAEIFNKYNFETIAPDQDYLNFLCKDKVYYLDDSWNVMWSRKKYKGKPRVIHYNMFKKPWIYPRMRFGTQFRRYADRTVYARDIEQMKKRITLFARIRDMLALKGMLEKSKKISDSDNTFYKTLG